MSYLLWRSTGALVAAAGTTFTHSLSRATADLFAIITSKGTSTLSIPFLSSITPDTVVVGATGNNTPIDLAIVEFHSIQGGPG
jgi:hypothetical protein